MTSSLFTGAAGEPLDPETTVAASVLTPLGVIESRITCEKVLPKAATGLMLPGGQRVSTWDSPALRIELVEATYEPVLPAGMDVAGTRIMIWRMSAVEKVESIRVEAGMTDPVGVALSGPASGEGLNAVEFYSPDCSVHLGTEDEDWIAARAAKGKCFPVRWSDWHADLWWPPSAPPNHPWFEQTDTSIALNFPDLLPGDVCQVHFSVAWHSHPLEDDVPAHERSVDSWFAVDVPVDNILIAAGIDL